MTSIAERLRVVQTRVRLAADRAGRDPASVTLVAVSKRMPVSAIREAYAAGARDFGENYAAELADKIAETGTLSDLRWHMIGHLQSNKAKLIAGVTLLHTVDGAAIVRSLATRFPDRTTNVLVQVNIAGETQKSGAAPAAVPAILAAIDETAGKIVARGLMTMPPQAEDPDAMRPVFRALRTLRDRLGGADRLPELSMGMSGDYEVAIAEGATLVRVGTAIFGARS